METTEDKEWVAKLVEQVDIDLNQSFSTHYWPGQLESLGSLQWDAVQVQQSVRKARLESGNTTAEIINAPVYSVWAPHMTEST